MMMTQPSSHHPRSYSGLSLSQNIGREQPVGDPSALRKLSDLLCFSCSSCVEPQPFPASSQSLPDFIIFNPFYRRYVKHATLIERCFPLEKDNNASPNSNELSYLVYYAQSKPAKLTKVGTYLSKRALRDVQKHRYSDIRVTLCIFDALLEACGDDLHFFAKDVLETLNTGLSLNESVLSKASMQTFVLFCRKHTGSALAIDKDLCALYCGIIRTFASFAMKCDSKKDTDLSLAALGLRAIQAVAESRATYAADCFYELPCVVKAIVTSIAQTYTPGESVSVAIAEDRLGTIDEMSDLSAVPNNAVLCRWAWLCLGTLVRGSHGQHSHVIVAEVFKRLDQGLQWQPAPLCVQIVTDVIGNLQSQDRNMVIVEILGLLTNGMHASNLYAGGTLNNSTSSFKGLGSAVLRQTDGPPETQAADSSKEANMRTCISRILERLFCQPHVLVGISVMDVLNVLVTFLIESVAGKRIVVPDFSVFSAVLKAMLAGNEFDIGREFETSNVSSDYYYLLAAIGGLARHHYYSNQVADMIEYLVQRMQLKWSGSSERDDQNRHSIRQHWLVQVLYIVLVNCKAAQEIPTSAFMLPFRTFAPVFTLMSHENQALRIQAADCVILILQHNHANGANQESNDSWQPEVVEAVYRKLGGLLRQEHQADASLASTAGYAAIAGVLYGLLCAQRSHAIKHTLVLVDSCAPINMNEAWITTLGMICKQAARLSTNDIAAEANISATIEKARNSGVWSSEIEDVCMNRLPAISLYINSTDEKAAKEAASASVNNVTNTDGGDIAFFQKALGPASIMDMLEADVAAQYEELRSKQGSISEGYWESDSESVDRMLCSPGEDSAPAREMQNSVSQVNDIRARVSVDWETQMRRDSILAPHVNIDQLRMALHDGLSVHSSEHLASISVNENRARIVPRSNISESSVYYPYGSVVDAGTARGTSKKAAPNDDYSGEEDLDMYGRPLPEDVRDLLDSIDNDDYDNGGIIIARPPPKRSDGRILDEDIATHGSPAISTPVVGNVE